MSRRRKLFVFLVAIAATLVYALWRAPEWGARLVESTLERRFRRPVRVESLRVRPATLELELRGLRIGGPTPEAPPFLEIAVVRVRPSFAPLRGNHVVLSRVRIEQPRLYVEAYPAPPRGPGGDNIPKLGGGKGGALQVHVGRLVVVGGEFVLDHARVPLDLDLPNFQGRLNAGASGGLTGHVSFSTGRLRMGAAPELPVGTEIDATYSRGLLSVDAGRLVAEGTTIDYSGRLQLAGRPQGQLRLGGDVDLAVLERHVFRSGLGFAGAAQWDGILSIDGSRLRIEGRMQGTGGQFRTVAVPRFAGALSYDGTSGLVLRDLDVDALGGSARLGIEVPPAATGRPLHIGGPVRDTDGEAVLRLVFGWGDMGVGTAATGDVDVSWPRGAARRVSGRVAVDLAERADGRFPVSGRVDWSAKDGAQSFERVELHGPRLEASVAGTVDPQDRADLAVDGETGDVAAADALLARLRRALGSPEAQPAGFAGRGSFTGPLAQHRRVAGFRRPLHGRRRRLRRRRVGPCAVGGCARHRGAVRRVALARADEGRRPADVGRPHRDRLVRAGGCSLRPRADRQLAGRRPRAVHGVERDGERHRERRGTRPRPPQRTGGRGPPHRARRQVPGRAVRPRARRHAVGAPGRGGHRGRGRDGRRPRALPRQRDERRRLRRLRRDAGRRPRRARAGAGGERRVRRPALRPRGAAGHAHAPAPRREPPLAPSLRRRRGHRRSRGAAVGSGRRPRRDRRPLPLGARRSRARRHGGHRRAVRGRPQADRPLHERRPVPARRRSRR